MSVDVLWSLRATCGGPALEALEADSVSNHGEVSALWTAVPSIALHTDLVEFFDGDVCFHFGLGERRGIDELFEGALRIGALCIDIFCGSLALCIFV